MVNIGAIKTIARVTAAFFYPVFRITTPGIDARRKAQHILLDYTGVNTLDAENDPKWQPGKMYGWLPLLAVEAAIGGYDFLKGIIKDIT